MTAQYLVYPTYSGGNGSSSNPYILATREDFDDLTNTVNAGYLNGYSGVYFKVVPTNGSSVAMGGNFTPIGTGTYPFKGVVDGNGKTVSGYTTAGGIQYSGLFGNVSGATIRNLTVSGFFVNGDNTSHGAVVGRIAGASTIENCHAKSGTVWATHQVGGIVGFSDGAGNRVTNCTTDGAVYVYASGRHDSDNQYRVSAGGIVGYANNNVKITGCSNAATVGYANNDEKRGLGGILGAAFSNAGAVIENCRNTGKVGFLNDNTTRGTATRGVGGIVGYANVTVTLNGCTNGGQIVGGQQVGGIIGYGNGTMSGTFSNTGAITADVMVGGIGGQIGMSFGESTFTNSGTISSGGNSVGGCFGFINQPLKNATNTGAVTGGCFVGGIVGRAQANITNSKNTGTIMATDYGSIGGETPGTGAFVGGIVGYIHLNDRTVRNAYNSGNVLTNGQSNRNWVGAIAGFLAGGASYCYAQGEVKGAEYIGGMFGQINGTPVYCYFNGKVNSDYSGRAPGVIMPEKANGSSNWKLPSTQIWKNGSNMTSWNPVNNFWDANGVNPTGGTIVPTYGGSYTETTWENIVSLNIDGFCVKYTVTAGNYIASTTTSGGSAFLAPNGARAYNGVTSDASSYNAPVTSALLFTANQNRSLFTRLTAISFTAAQSKPYTGGGLAFDVNAPIGSTAVSVVNSYYKNSIGSTVVAPPTQAGVYAVKTDVVYAGAVIGRAVNGKLTVTPYDISGSTVVYKGKSSFSPGVAMTRNVSLARWLPAGNNTLPFLVFAHGAVDGAGFAGLVAGNSILGLSMGGLDVIADTNKIGGLPNVAVAVSGFDVSGDGVSWITVTVTGQGNYSGVVTFKAFAMSGDFAPGSTADTFLISSWHHLYRVSQISNGTTECWTDPGVISFSAKTIKQTVDLTATTAIRTGDWSGAEAICYSFVPIGGVGGKSFYGTYDGQGRVVSLTIGVHPAARSGFIGYLAGTVKNLTINGTVAPGADYVGAFAGEMIYSNAMVVYCVNNAAVSGIGYVGGIAGIMHGNSRISGCVNNASVTGSGHGIGGIAGHLSLGRINNCINKGAVTSTLASLADTDKGIGGIAGTVLSGASYVKYSLNSGAPVTGPKNVGGIVGAISSGVAVSDCYNYLGPVNAGSVAGGIAGHAGGGSAVDHCWAFYRGNSYPPTLNSVGKRVRLGSEATISVNPTYGGAAFTDAVWEDFKRLDAGFDSLFAFDGFRIAATVADGYYYSSLKAFSRSAGALASPGYLAADAATPLASGTLSARYFADQRNVSDADFTVERITADSAWYLYYNEKEHDIFNKVNPETVLTGAGLDDYNQYISNKQNTGGVVFAGDNEAFYAKIDSYGTDPIFFETGGANAGYRFLITYSGLEAGRSYPFAAGTYDTVIDIYLNGVLAGRKTVSAGGGKLGVTIGTRDITNINLMEFRYDGIASNCDVTADGTAFKLSYRSGVYDNQAALVYNGALCPAGREYSDARFRLLDAFLGYLGQDGSIYTVTGVDGSLAGVNEVTVTLQGVGNFSGVLTLRFVVMDSDFGMTAGQSRTNGTWGGADNPFLITHWAHMIRLSWIVGGSGAPWDSVSGQGLLSLDANLDKSTAVSTARFAGGSFTLGNDLTGAAALTSDIKSADSGGSTTLRKGFVPVGFPRLTASGTVLNPFSGSFDGGGHTIELDVRGSNFSGQYVGLFGQADYYKTTVNGVTTVYNVSLKNLNLTGRVDSEYAFTGALAGFVRGESTAYPAVVTGINSSVEINGNKFTGGIIGRAINSAVSNLSNAGAVSGRGSYFVGGLIGYASSSVLNGTLVNTGSVGTASVRSRFVGGLFGALLSCTLGDESTLLRNTGDVRSAEHYVGGILGAAGATLIYMPTEASVVNEATISGGNYVGGLAGYIGSLLLDATGEPASAATGAPDSGGNTPYSKALIYLPSAGLSDVSGGDYVGGLFGKLANEGHIIVDSAGGASAAMTAAETAPDDSAGAENVTPGWKLVRVSDYYSKGVFKTGSALSSAAWNLITVSNTTVLNSAISGGSNVGGIAGELAGAAVNSVQYDATAANAATTALAPAVAGGSNVGGFVGLLGAGGNLIGSFASEKAVSGSGAFVGGIIGKVVSGAGAVYTMGTTVLRGTYSIVASMENTGGAVTAGSHAGGILGGAEDNSAVQTEKLYTRFEWSGGGVSAVNTANVTSAGEYAGGIAGSVGNNTLMFLGAGSRSGFEAAGAATCTIKGSSFVGGLFGSLGSGAHNINGAFSTSFVAFTTNRTTAGGLAGYMGGGTIQNSFVSPASTTLITTEGLFKNLSGTSDLGDSAILGGLVGSLQGGTLSGSYSQGFFYSYDSPIRGAVAGTSHLTEATITNSWGLYTTNDPDFDYSFMVLNRNGKYILAPSIAGWTSAFMNVDELKVFAGITAAPPAGRSATGPSTRAVLEAEKGRLNLRVGMPPSRTVAGETKVYHIAFYDVSGSDSTSDNNFELSNDGGELYIRVDTSQASFSVCRFDIAFQNVNHSSPDKEAEFEAKFRAPAGDSRYKARITSVTGTTTITVSGYIEYVPNGAAHRVSTDFTLTYTFGSAAMPKSISSLSEWRTFASGVRSTGNNEHWILLANIGTVTISDLAGDLSENDTGRNFKGSFDGNGFTITVDIRGTSQATNNRLSLFPGAAGATFKNLTIAGSVAPSTVNGNNGFDIGAFVGKPFGDLKFYNCTNRASITSERMAGGIVGFANGKNLEFVGCVNLGSIWSRNNYRGDADQGLGTDTGAEGACTGTGGILGHGGSYSGGVSGRITIDSCRNAGSVTANGHVGGIIGTARTNVVISNSANTGYIWGNAGYSNPWDEADDWYWCYVGGIMGMATDIGSLELYASYNSGTVVAQCSIAGGLIGADVLDNNNKSVYTKIYYCYNSGDVYAGGTNNNQGANKYGNEVGGLAGKTGYADIRYCYNTGNVTAQGSKTENLINHARAGGLVGTIRNNDGARIYSSYNVGLISVNDTRNTIVPPSGKATDAAGIIGHRVEDVRATVDKCYSLKNSVYYKRDNAYVDQLGSNVSTGTLLDSLADFTAAFHGSNGTAGMIYPSYTNSSGGTTSLWGVGSSSYLLSHPEDISSGNYSGWVYVYGCLPQLSVFAVDTADGLSMLSKTYGEDDYGNYILQSAGDEFNPYVIKDGLDLMGLSALINANRSKIGAASAGAYSYWTAAGKYFEFANGENNLEGDVARYLRLGELRNSGASYLVPDGTNSYKFSSDGVSWQFGKNRHLYEKGAILRDNPGVNSDTYAAWLAKNHAYKGTDWVGNTSFNEANFYPISMYGGGRDKRNFSGSINGAMPGGGQIEIQNLRVKYAPAESGSDAYAGLFGRVYNATIQNITIEGYVSDARRGYIEGWIDGTASRTVYAGVVAYADGNCTISGIKAGKAGNPLRVTSGKEAADRSGGAVSRVGAVVGAASVDSTAEQLTVRNCAVYADVTGFHASTGGVVGRVEGSNGQVLIVGCRMTGGTIQGSGNSALRSDTNSWMGGIVGARGSNASLSIEGCAVGSESNFGTPQATAAVVIKGENAIGGIISQANGNTAIRDCVVYGDVKLLRSTNNGGVPVNHSVAGTAFGGIVGYTEDGECSINNAQFHGIIDVYGSIGVPNYDGGSRSSSLTPTPTENVGGIVGFMGVGTKILGLIAVDGEISVGGHVSQSGGEYVSNSRNVGGVAGKIGIYSSGTVDAGVLFAGTFEINPKVRAGYSDNVGGFIGLNDGTGNVVSTATITIGYDNTPAASMTADATAAAVRDNNPIYGAQYVGGFIGRNNKDRTIRVGATSYGGIAYIGDGIINIYATIDGKGRVGGFIGANEGFFETVRCLVTNHGEVGNSAFSNDLEIANSDANPTHFTELSRFGGILGANPSGTLTFAEESTFVNRGQVGHGVGFDSLSVQYFVGGIIGSSSGNLDIRGTLTNNGVVYGGNYVGGSIGRLRAGVLGGLIVNNGAVYGNIVDPGVGNYVGGSIGAMSGTLDGAQLLNRGKIRAKSYSGGTIGVMNGAIKNSYIANESDDVRFSGGDAVGGTIGLITTDDDGVQTSVVDSHFEYSRYSRDADGNYLDRNGALIDNSLPNWESRRVALATTVTATGASTAAAAVDGYAYIGGVGGIIGLIDQSTADSVERIEANEWSGNSFYVAGSVEAASAYGVGGVVGAIRKGWITVANMLVYSTVASAAGSGDAMSAAAANGDLAGTNEVVITGRDYVGGIVGFNGSVNDNSGETASLAFCYNIEGAINATAADAKNYGGLVGGAGSVSKTYACYWVRGMTNDVLDNIGIDTLPTQINMQWHSMRTGLPAGVYEIKQRTGSEIDTLNLGGNEFTVTDNCTEDDYLNNTNIPLDIFWLDEAFNIYFCEDWDDYFARKYPGLNIVKGVVDGVEYRGYYKWDTWDAYIEDANLAARNLGIEHTIQRNSFGELGYYASDGKEYSTGKESTGWYFVYTAVQSGESAVGDVTTVHESTAVGGSWNNIDYWKYIADTSDSNPAAEETSSIVYGGGATGGNGYPARNVMNAKASNDNLANGFYLYIASSGGGIGNISRGITAVQPAADPSFYISIDGRTAENVIVAYRRLNLAKDSLVYNGLTRIAPVDFAKRGIDDAAKLTSPPVGFDPDGKYYYEAVDTALDSVNTAREANTAGKYDAVFNIYYKPAGSERVLVGRIDSRELSAGQPTDMAKSFKWSITQREVDVTKKSSTGVYKGSDSRYYLEFVVTNIALRDTSETAKLQFGFQLLRGDTDASSATESVIAGAAANPTATIPTSGISYNYVYWQYDSSKVTKFADDDRAFNYGISEAELNSTGTVSYSYRIYFKDAGKYRASINSKVEPDNRRNYGSRFAFSADAAVQRKTLIPTLPTDKVEEMYTGDIYDFQVIFGGWATGDNGETLEEGKTLIEHVYAAMQTVNFSANPGAAATNNPVLDGRGGTITWKEKNKNTYELSWPVSKIGRNYRLDGQSTVTFIITDLKLVVEWGFNNNAVYNGEEHTYPVTIKPSNLSDGKILTTALLNEITSKLSVTAGRAAVTDPQHDGVKNISFIASATDAGVYTISIAAIEGPNGNYGMDAASNSFTIKRRAVNIADVWTTGVVNGGQIEYNTSHQGLSSLTAGAVAGDSASGLVAGENVSDAITVVNTGGVSNQSPTQISYNFRDAIDVGAYKVSVSADPNYIFPGQAVLLEYIWEITKKQIRISIDSTDQTFAYDGELHNPNIKLDGSSAAAGDSIRFNNDTITVVNFSLSGGETIENLCNAGTYSLSHALTNANCKAVRTGSSPEKVTTSNYEITGGTGTTRIIIRPRDIDFSWSTASSFVYTGSRHGPELTSGNMPAALGASALNRPVTHTAGATTATMAGAQSTETISYAIANSYKISAGDYTASVSIASVSGQNKAGATIKDNYNVRNNTTKGYNIAKSIISIQSVNAITKVYDGTTAYYGGISGVVFSSSNGGAKNPSYTATAVYADKNAGSGNKTAAFTVSLSAGSSPNFTLGTRTFESGNNSITPRPLTIVMNTRGTGTLKAYMTYTGSNVYGSAYNRSGTDTAKSRPFIAGKGITVSGFAPADPDNYVSVNAVIAEAAAGRQAFDSFVNNVVVRNGEYVVGTTPSYKKLVFSLSKGLNGDSSASLNYSYQVDGFSQSVTPGGSTFTIWDSGDKEQGHVNSSENRIEISITKYYVTANYSNSSQSYANSDNTYNRDWKEVAAIIDDDLTVNNVTIIVDNNWMWQDNDPTTGVKAEYRRYTRIYGNASDASSPLHARLASTDDSGRHVNYVLRNQPTLVIGYFVDNKGYEVGSLAGLMLASYYYGLNYLGAPTQTVSSWTLLCTYEDYMNNVGIPTLTIKDESGADVETSFDTWEAYLTAFELKYNSEHPDTPIEIIDRPDVEEWGYWLDSEKTVITYTDFVQVANISGVMTERDYEILTAQFGNDWGVGTGFIPNFVKTSAGNTLTAVGAVFPGTFGGTYDGRGYVIDGLNILSYASSAVGEVNVGFFERIGQADFEAAPTHYYATGVNLRNVGVQVYDYAGTGTINVGGIVGDNAATQTILDSVFHGSIYVYAPFAAELNVGGIAGRSTTNAAVAIGDALTGVAVYGAYSLGKIEVYCASGVIANVGGIVGKLTGGAGGDTAYSGAIGNAVSMAEIYVEAAAANVGGLIGSVDGQTSADGALKGTNAFMSDAVYRKSGGTYTAVSIAAGNIESSSGYGASYTALMNGSNSLYGGKDAGTYDFLTFMQASAATAPSAANQKISNRLNDVFSIWVLGFGLRFDSAATPDNPDAGNYALVDGTLTAGRRGTDNAGDAIIIANGQHVALLREFRFASYRLTRDVVMYTQHTHAVFGGVFFGRVDADVTDPAAGSTAVINLRGGAAAMFEHELNPVPVKLD